MGNEFLRNIAVILAENAIETIFAVLGILITAFGAWALNKIGKKAGFETIATATDEVIKLAGITIGELQQTIVDELKANAADGKLTQEEIETLGHELVRKTLEKMSQPVYNLLYASGTDIIALIIGAGEDWINSLKNAE